jgi:hypothetical protein
MSESAAPERPEFIDRLPAFDPPDVLWARVVARRAARERRTRLARVGVAAVLLASVALGWRVTREGGDELAAASVQARALESELARLRPTAAEPAQTAREVEARLARVDAQLQAAYDRGAAHADLVTLWRERAELESALLAAYQRPVDLVRL